MQPLSPPWPYRVEPVCHSGVLYRPESRVSRYKSRGTAQRFFSVWTAFLSRCFFLYHSIDFVSAKCHFIDIGVQSSNTPVLVLLLPIHQPCRGVTEAACMSCLHTGVQTESWW